MRYPPVCCRNDIDLFVLGSYKFLSLKSVSASALPEYFKGGFGSIERHLFAYGWVLDETYRVAYSHRFNYYSSREHDIIATSPNGDLNGTNLNWEQYDSLGLGWVLPGIAQNSGGRSWMAFRPDTRVTPSRAVYWDAYAAHFTYNSIALSNNNRRNNFIGSGWITVTNELMLKDLAVRDSDFDGLSDYEEIKFALASTVSSGTASLSVSDNSVDSESTLLQNPVESTLLITAEDAVRLAEDESSIEAEPDITNATEENNIAIAAAAISNGNDFDGDGVTDIVEIQQHSDPTDPTDHKPHFPEEIAIIKFGIEALGGNAQIIPYTNQVTDAARGVRVLNHFDPFPKSRDRYVTSESHLRKGKKYFLALGMEDQTGTTNYGWIFNLGLSDTETKIHIPNQFFNRLGLYSPPLAAYHM